MIRRYHLIAIQFPSQKEIAPQKLLDTIVNDRLDFGSAVEFPYLLPDRLTLINGF